jgi:sugar fermentation stimulation protein A
MQFKTKLIKGKLIKRYKRFLADIQLENGNIVTAHCANSGSMMTVKDIGAKVWISESFNPKRKLKYTWEIIEVNGFKVGINTSLPNYIVEEAINLNKIPELINYETLKKEVKYGANSRIDILLSSKTKPDCYVEVKNVSMKRNNSRVGRVEFPDAITKRGTKHLLELSNMSKLGFRSVMFFLIQREDCNIFSIANDIDPEYKETLEKAINSGVEVLCYKCKLTSKNIDITSPIEFILK